MKNCFKYWSQSIQKPIMSVILLVSILECLILDGPFQTESLELKELSHQYLLCVITVTCDYQQCGILTSVDSDEPLQPPFKLRNSKWCSVSSLTIIEYSSD